MLSDFTKIELTPKQRGFNPIKTLVYFLVAFFLKIICRLFYCRSNPKNGFSWILKLEEDMEASNIPLLYQQHYCYY